MLMSDDCILRVNESIGSVVRRTLKLVSLFALRIISVSLSVNAMISCAEIMRVIIVFILL